MAPGALALLLLWLSVGGALAALLTAAPEFNPSELWHDTYLRRVVWFTCWPAAPPPALSGTGAADQVI